MPYQLGLWRVACSPLCQACLLYPKEIGYLCQPCHDEMNYLPEPLNILLDTGDTLPIVYATSYTGVMRQAIAGFKDDGNVATLPILLQALRELADIMPTDAVILPVPTTHARLRERGFFPVGLLARYLSHFSGLPIYEGVVRHMDSVRQRHLGRAERLHNLDNAFVMSYEPPTDSVILFDDVATTGSTLKSLVQTLYECDTVRDVGAVCLVHGDGR
ncbi:MAG: hypothetical protein Q4G13_09670 [Moraxella sp.]|nr:hypothetical protein [Moraxella sp.]